MTGSRPDPRASDDDLDPTGVRALLAQLPDPGPMPDDLMARISHSLELEQERRAAGSTHSVPPGASADQAAAVTAEGPGGQVVSLTAERERRRPGRTVLWLGSAAAVAMIATVSVNQLIGGGSTGDSGVAANVPVSSDSADGGADAGDASDHAASDDSGSQAEAGAEGQTNEGDQAPAQPDPPLAGTEDGAADEESVGPGEVIAPTQVHGLPGTIELSATGWDEQVSSWISDSPARGDSNWSAQEADDCVTVGDLDTGLATTVMLSEAVWDDRPATLVVARATAGDQAWVLTPDCGDVLSGPVPLN